MLQMFIVICVGFLKCQLINYFRSENGLLAYGSNNLVVIVDAAKVIPVQCFTDHKALIKKVNFMKNICSIYTIIST